MEGLANFLVAGKVQFAVVFDLEEGDDVSDIQANAIDALRDYIDNNHVVNYAFREKKKTEEEGDDKEQEVGKETAQIHSCCGEM